MAAKTTDEEGKRILAYQLFNLKISEKDKLVSAQLKMPSVLPPRHDSIEQGNYPTVVLDLKCLNDDGDRCSQMMKDIVHPNILNARVIMEGGSQYLLWVEPYTGNLLDYLEISLGGPLAPKGKRSLLPSEILHKIVRQILHGLEHLMIEGYYHGNFTLKGTYYHWSKFEIFVKLTNFKKKSGRKSACQWEDLLALGTELMTVLSIADKLNKENLTGHVFDTTLLDDLAKKLKLVTQRNLGSTYVEIKKHVFFWERYERKRFFVYRVATKMKLANFKSKVKKCEGLCSLPWDLDDHDGFLQKMNQYRSDNNMSDYYGYSKCDFVDFICGLYAHEHEPQLRNNGKKVDDTITRIHPHVCLILSNLLQSSDGDWL